MNYYRIGSFHRRLRGNLLASGRPGSHLGLPRARHAGFHIQNQTTRINGNDLTFLCLRSGGCRPAIFRGDGIRRRGSGVGPVTVAAKSSAQPITAWF